MAVLSNVLDRFYLILAWLSGVLLILLCCLVLYSILTRIFGLFGGGASDMAGYVMATSIFMALPYTFRSHGHIRVSLLIQRFYGVTRRRIEIFCLALMSIVTVYVAFYMTRLVIDSYEFGERSEGADAILMWIPQTPVAVGSVLFAVAAIHTLVEALTGIDTSQPPENSEMGSTEI